jgi:redox-sensitive bicupin YhaK (pirin superfamily)
LAALFIDIADGQDAGAGFSHRERDCASSAPGTDEEYALTPRVMALPKHPQNTAPTIEHSASPTPLGIPDNVDGTDRACARVQFVNQLRHPDLVWHRYEQAVEIGHPPHARNKRIKSIGGNLHWNADRISSLRQE